MEAKITSFNIKVKKISGGKMLRMLETSEENLTWEEFERLFRRKYMSERYYHGMAKEFYELKMGSMKDGEYTTKFLQLRYMPCLKDVK